MNQNEIDISKEIQFQRFMRKLVPASKLFENKAIANRCGRNLKLSHVMERES